VDVTLTDGNGASHTPPTGSCTGAGANTDPAGQCTITFSSSATGTVTGHATSTLLVAGLSITVQTNGQAGNSSDAVKTYVNAKIAIAPSATNRVGQPHTFTVTLSKDIGDGNGFVPAAGEHVDVTLTDGNGASHTPPTGSCTNAGANTNAAGQCTITFSSPTTGTVTGHATSTLSVGGVSITVATDGVAPNSGDAVKTYVDATISIAPSATNEVGKSHTFTVTLSKDVGDGAGFVAAAGEHVDVTLTDSNGASHTPPTGSCTNAGANTDAAGQCTITFTSNAAGQVNGHATSTLSVGGVSITVATDGVAPNSGDAVKTFVDANIHINPPTATNPTGTTHVLTSNVMVNDGQGGGFVPAPNGTVITHTIVSGPGSFVGGISTCTVTNGLGSCTVTITSSVAGTTVVRASVTLSVGGISLTRTTNDGVHGDGSDAQKIWQPPATQQCTLGFWKQQQHFHFWVGYTPGQKWSSVFSPLSSVSQGQYVGRQDPTLLQALQASGGGVNDFMRHAVAELLNSSSLQSPDESTAQVITEVNAAIAAYNASGPPKDVSILTALAAKYDAQQQADNCTGFINS
jgi:hypothetical protein